MKRLVPAVLALAFAAQGHAEQLYRWVDGDGKVHYTDKQPPKEAKDVEKKRVATRAGDVQLPYAVRKAAETFPVTVFNADCGDPCDAARKLLETRGIPYTDRNARDAEVQVALKKLTGGAVEVPLMQVGRTTVKGWEPGQWNTALDAAGYPKTAGIRPPLPKREVAKSGPVASLPSDKSTPTAAPAPRSSP